MELKTKEFQEVAKAILIAANASKDAGTLSLEVRDQDLYLSVTDGEYFCSIRFQLDQPEAFKAVVDAGLFLNLIAGLTTDTFKLEIQGNAVQVKSGKSSYKLPMIYENNSIMQLPAITLHNKTVDMTISNDILKSILNVNSRELLKEAASTSANINELQRFYYVTEEGCFTFTTGACLNSFQLDKPVKMLLTEKIVKLFKLFKGPVQFSMGYDTAANGNVQAKAVFQSDDIYVAALITTNDLLLAKVQGPCMATKNLIETHYSINAVISANKLVAAISRLLMFAKNNLKNSIKRVIASVTFDPGTREMLITDNDGNTESIEIDNDSSVLEPYTLMLNLVDLKLILDTCKNEYVTVSCGTGKAVVVTRNNISNLLPEARPRSVEA